MGNTHFSVIPCTLPKNDPRYIRWKNSLKKRPGPWNKGLTKETDKRVKKFSNTLRNKEIDNFKNWREDARRRNVIPNTNKPLKRSKKLAFLIGLVLGDGNISHVSRTECLAITLGTDKPLLWKYASMVVEQVFNKKPAVRKRKAINCVDIRLYQNNLSKRIGIKTGKRKYKKLSIPRWIYRNKLFLIEYIKGLFEAEGSFSVHKNTYTYNLSFSNLNISLLNQVERCLIKWGFHPERRISAVRLRRKNEVYRLITIISFRSYPLI